MTTAQTEHLGPAERIIQTLLAYSDHLVHNRAGMVSSAPSSVTGVQWVPCTWKREGDARVVYRKTKAGKRTELARAGVLNDRGLVMDGTRVVGRYMDPGIFPEVAAWMYRQVAEVWKLDNEFAARWASYAFTQDHRDLKVVLAAFLLVQSRKGDPVRENGTVAFHDDDYRDVGEAMMLLDGKAYLDLKMLLRVRALLGMPEIAAINRELGFGASERRPFYGRFDVAAHKWLRYREENAKLLNGLLKKGFRRSLKTLALATHYKPASAKFFAALRWKQEQSREGHRTIAIGETVAAAQTWVGLTEAQICERIVAERPGFKRIIGMLPSELGLTRAILAAAIEAGALSSKDLIIYTPTLEELGLLEVPEIKTRWETAIQAAEDQRSANIAARVRSEETKQKLQEAADTAVQKAVEEVVRGLRVYVFVDISGSMEGAIAQAKAHITKLLPAFPLDRLHVATFNTVGRVVSIKHASAAGVENAFRGITAGGGTAYAEGVRALQSLRPAADEDVLFIFVGDEQDSSKRSIAEDIRATGLNPLAIGLIPVVSAQYGRGYAVRMTAIDLGVPCFEIDERVFSDPYAVPRTLRNLIAATPVNRAQHGTPAVARVALVETILKTPILVKPVWAA